MYETVIAYVDGFNLYFGLRAKKWKKYYWLNIFALSQALLKKHQRLHLCHYFTARIRGVDHQDDAPRRQTVYLDALTTIKGVRVHEGHFLAKKERCRSCHAEHSRYEEKKTDVHIAVRMVADAYEKRMDTVLLVSADSDLSPAVEQVRKLNKKIIVAFPPKRYSDELRRIAHACLHINASLLKKCQLPDIVYTESRHPLKRPEQWR
ncbi:MAG: NYN domain-containing protein [Zetaproteobacteria bacterium]|nr:MAG: NYN domain-containing protein [Zetaproteobacteria bacterium]